MADVYGSIIVLLENKFEFHVPCHFREMVFCLMKALRVYGILHSSQCMFYKVKGGADNNQSDAGCKENR